MDESAKKYSGKSTPGYLKRYRRVNIIWLIVWIVIGVGIFTTGWFIWHTRANILTVLAVLMVLPGAKRIIALIAAGKKKSVALDRCAEVEALLDPFVYAGEIDLHEYDPEEDDEEEDENERDGDDYSEEYRSGNEEPVIPYNVIYTDYVFTSTEKIMMLDFLVVTQGSVFILPTSTTVDTDYIRKYLTSAIRTCSEAVDIRMMKDDKGLLFALENLQESNEPIPGRHETLKLLKSLAM